MPRTCEPSPRTPETTDHPMSTKAAVGKATNATSSPTSPGPRGTDGRTALSAIAPSVAHSGKLRHLDTNGNRKSMQSGGESTTATAMTSPAAAAAESCEESGTQYGAEGANVTVSTAAMATKHVGGKAVYAASSMETAVAAAAAPNGVLKQGFGLPWILQSNDVQTDTSRSMATTRHVRWQSLRRAGVAGV